MKRDPALPNYAKTLFNMADSTQTLEKWLGELDHLINLIKQTPALEAMLSHPFIRQDKKKAALQRVLDGQIEKTPLHFLFLLIDKKKIVHLKEVVERFRALVFQRIGILNAVVTSVIPLKEEEIQKIKQKLEGSLHKKLHLSNRIDPHILGGLIITAESQMFDDSVRSRLMELKATLLV